MPYSSGKQGYIKTASLYSVTIVYQFRYAVPQKDGGLSFVMPDATVWQLCALELRLTALPKLCCSSLTSPQASHCIYVHILSTTLQFKDAYCNMEDNTKAFMLMHSSAEGNSNCDANKHSYY